MSITTGSFITTVTPANGSPITFYYANFNLVFSPSTATCTKSAASCAVGQVGITPGATITGPVTGTFFTAPVIRTSQGVITAGAYGGFSAIAPGTWIEIYGQNVATTLSQTWAASDFKGSQAPSALGGTTVTVGGVPAFIDYVSPGQVNAQVPGGVAPESQPVIVTTAGGASVPYNIQVNTTEPGFLAPSSFIIGGKQYVVALLSGTLTYVLPVSLTGVTTARVKPGQSITMYGVGFGKVTPNTPPGQIVSQTSALPAFTASFGGVPAVVTYAGLAPGFVGLYQFNVTVPNVAASDMVPFTFSLGSNTGAQTMVISVGN